MRLQLLTVEFNDLGGYRVKRLDDACALRVRGETLSERGNRRGEMNAGTVIRIGNIESQYRAVVAVDHDLARERLWLPQQARWKYIAYCVKDYLAERGCSVKVAGLRRAGAAGGDCFGLAQVSRAEQDVVAPTRPAHSLTIPMCLLRLKKEIS